MVIGAITRTNGIETDLAASEANVCASTRLESRTFVRSGSPQRNRVTPFGEIVAVPLRGAYTGNRGRLHRGHEIVRLHAHDSWVTCALRFNDRWNEQWLPHRFTWLYFQDEAVAFAAGHRPCGECRHADYKRYQAAWAVAAGGEPPSAREMNRQLHGERIVRGTHRRRLHVEDGASLPDGTFIAIDGRPHLILGKSAVEWTTDGYRVHRPRPSGPLTVITPPSTVAVLRAGYPVDIAGEA
jgi:hypothetical protein